MHSLLSNPFLLKVRGRKYPAPLIRKVKVEFSLIATNLSGDLFPPWQVAISRDVKSSFIFIM